jgi:cardiolipin synthase
MDLIGKLTHVWQYLLATLTLVVSVIASGHALLFKKDSRSAVLWVGLIWLTPLVGALLYFILGINRIRRRAVLLRRGWKRWQSETKGSSLPVEVLQSELPASTENLVALAHVVDKVVECPLLPGNRIEPLVDGDSAYPAMLDAIAGAQKSVTLCTYIFDRDDAGRAFAKALGEAKRRGVAVRVLIDATGTRCSWPSILRTLRHEGVPYARFCRRSRSGGSCR